MTGALTLVAGVSAGAFAGAFWLATVVAIVSESGACLLAQTHSSESDSERWELKQLVPFCTSVLMPALLAVMASASPLIFVIVRN